MGRGAFDANLHLIAAQGHQILGLDVETVRFAGLDAVNKAADANGRLRRRRVDTLRRGAATGGGLQRRRWNRRLRRQRLCHGKREECRGDGSQEEGSQFDSYNHRSTLTEGGAAFNATGKLVIPT